MRSQRPLRAGMISRYVLPVVLFVGIIGGIAWLTQYMPSWRTPDTSPGSAVKKDTSPAQDVLKFTRTRAVWDFDEQGQDTGYVREYERGVEGHYDFPFRNVLGKPAEIGLLAVSCDCTSAEVAFLPKDEWERVVAELSKRPWADVEFTSAPDWHKVTKDENEGLPVPADAHGLVRVTWKGRKETGERLRTQLRFWSQPAGDLSGRQFETIEVPVVMADAVMADPPRQSVGVLGPGDAGRAEIYLWSATRGPDELRLAVQNDPDDPLFHFEGRPLTEKERDALQGRLLEKKIYSKVRAGYVVSATVHEQKAGKQLDQGPFHHAVPLLLDEIPLEAPPKVTGTVRGDVEVGAQEEQGKINLKSFSAREGLRRTIPLYARAGAKLEAHGQHPAALEYRLTRAEGGAPAGRERWNLELSIPPFAWSGPLPENAAVILRVGGEQPRLVRIPVVGNAVLSPAAQ